MSTFLTACRDRYELGRLVIGLTDLYQHLRDWIGRQHCPEHAIISENWVSEATESGRFRMQSQSQGMRLRSKYD